MTPFSERQKISQWRYDMRCVIYSRVSTDKQETENQVVQLKEYAARQNWTIIEVVTDVCSGGKSAEERTGLKKVFQMAHQKKFDVLLFWALDRFSREGSRQTLAYLTKLDEYKVKWHSYTEEYISSLGIFADAIISIMASLAKQERIRISERTKAGLVRIRKQGIRVGRPMSADIEKVIQLRQQNMSLAVIAKECGISKTRVHQILKESSHAEQ